MAEGYGILQWYKDGQPGERYEGELHEGKQNGHGVMKRPNGDRFEGQWRNGKANGAGRIVGSLGDFTGNWTDGCALHGKTWIGIGRPADTCR